MRNGGISTKNHAPKPAPRRPRPKRPKRQRRTTTNSSTYDEFPEAQGPWRFPSYPGEDRFSFFKGWNGGEATGLLKLAKELSKRVAGDHGGRALQGAPSPRAPGATRAYRGSYWPRNVCAEHVAPGGARYGAAGDLTRQIVQPKAQHSSEPSYTPETVERGVACRRTCLRRSAGCSWRTPARAHGRVRARRGLDRAHDRLAVHVLRQLRCRNGANSGARRPERREKPRVHGARALRDRDSNPNLPDQNRASLPIGLSRTVSRVEE